MLSRFFGKFGRKVASTVSAPPAEELLIVPIPSLVSILLALEDAKGSPLSEDEVKSARDGCACVAMPAAVAAKVAEERGYDDLDPDNIWEEWQAFLGSEEWRKFLATKEQS